MTSRNVSTSLESRLSEHLAELVRDQPACGMSGPTFDVDIELDVEGCRTVTTQSYRNGTLVDWAPCVRRAAVVVRCPVEGLAQLTPGHSTTLHTGVDLALVDQCFPVDILRSLDGLSDPALSIANLSIDIEVNEVPGSPGPVRLEVGAGLMRVGRSDGVDPADVSIGIPWITFESWRRGAAASLEVLGDGASVDGHWTELLCFHGIVQLASVRTRLVQAALVEDRILLWGSVIS